jgi:hypothetical protein
LALPVTDIQEPTEDAVQDPETLDAPDAVDPSEDPWPFSPQSLNDARKDSYMRLGWVRDLRTRVVRAYAGVCAEDQVDEPSYINLVEQAVDVLHPQLTSLFPKASAEPARTTRLAGAATIREASLNHTADEIELGETHSDAVLDALLGPFAVVRTGIRAGAEEEVVSGRRMNKGQFYANLIDLDDYVCDQAARRDGDFVFEGHRYRIPKETLMTAVKLDGSPMYDRKVAKGLETLSLNGGEEKGDVEELQGHHGDPYELVEMVELWEIAVYMGDRTIICTLHEGCDKWVRAPYEYWGPETGPYVKLSFLKIPNNAIGKVFAARVMNIADAINGTAEKVTSDIADEKTTYVYKQGEEDFADALRKSKNGEYLASDDPAAVNAVKSGGVQEQTIAAIAVLREWFNSAALSPDISGGQKDNSGTATGAAILNGNAQLRIKFMDGRSRLFLTRIFRHMAWYEDTDPLLQKTVVRRMPGGEKVELVNTAELREGEYGDYNFKTDSASFVPMDPMMMLARLMEFLRELPGLAQLGPDAFSKIVGIGSRRLDEPVLDEINLDPTNMQMREQAAAMAGGPLAGTAQQKGAAGGGARRIDQTRRDMAPATPPGY